MSVTDTNRQARSAKRPVALRDLRFAGTVAAGLVAGVLGVGALAAPLLGWSEWPDGLQPGRDETVQMQSPSGQQTVVQPQRQQQQQNDSSDQATGPVALVLPAGGGAAVGVGVSVPGTGGGSTDGTGSAPG